MCVVGCLGRWYSTICVFFCCFFLMIRRPPRSTLDRSSAASDVYKRQLVHDAPNYRNARVLSFSSHDVPIDLPQIEQFRGRGGKDREYTFNELIKVGSDTALPNRCLLYTSPSPRDRTRSRMPSSA